MIVKRICCKILTAVFALFELLDDTTAGFFSLFMVIVFYACVSYFFLSLFLFTPKTFYVLDTGSSIVKTQVQEKERTLEEIISELREKLDGIERR